VAAIILKGTQIQYPDDTRVHLQSLNSTKDYTPTHCQDKKPLKLRGFLVSFSAVNPCEARNRYLLLPSAPSTIGTKESQDYPVTADSNKLNARKCSDVL